MTPDLIGDSTRRLTQIMDRGHLFHRLIMTATAGMWPCARHADRGALAWPVGCAHAERFCPSTSPAVCSSQLVVVVNQPGRLSSCRSASDHLSHGQDVFPRHLTHKIWVSGLDMAFDGHDQFIVGIPAYRLTTFTVDQPGHLSSSCLVNSLPLILKD